ncbi:MAG: cation diffusion facilitator family transporter [Oscillospiraceae bacterium]|nr:cation diffusion facilitator family transporter [Oscillospiraceae bacterium]
MINKATATAFYSIGINSALTAAKFVVGVFANSKALISDGVDSCSDILSNVIVLLGVHFGKKASDDDHRYGHERIESVASIILATILVITSLGIGLNGIMQIITGAYLTSPAPGFAAIIVAGVSVIIKEISFFIVARSAKKEKSDALMADAWHHRSDALSSLGCLVGIVFSILGFKIADSIASLFICLLILKAAWGIFKEAYTKLTDKSCSEQMLEQIRSTTLECDGVLGVDDLRTRLFGSQMYVDIEICLDGKMTLFRAHEIAENVHDKLEENYPDIKHCMVHVNPQAAQRHYE